MKIDDASRQVDRADMDDIKAYANAIKSTSEDALNGDDAAIQRVKYELRAWALGETVQAPPGALLKVAALQFLGNEAVLPVRKAEESELPEALAAANIAYQAVCNDADRGDKLATFKVRVERFIRDNWPAGTFSDDMIRSICKIANRDKKTGPKRKKLV